MKFRLLNKWYANFMGYFWLPCPLCKQYFGGHEWKIGFGNSIKDESRLGMGICPDCAKKRVRKLLKKGEVRMFGFCKHNWKIISTSQIKITYNSGASRNATCILLQCQKCGDIKDKTIDGLFNLTNQSA